VVERALALLDSRFLSRVGNLQTAVKLALAVALALMAVVVGLIEAATELATVWVVLTAVGLFGVLAIALAHLFRRVAQRLVSHSSDDALANEAAHLATSISELLADLELDRPAPFDPDDDSREAWARRVNENRREELRALARYKMRYQHTVYVVATELGAPGGAI
jgi:hypothetical protein